MHVFLATRSHWSTQVGGMRLRVIRDFIRLEASAGIFLFLMAVLALCISNSAWSVHYDAFFDRAVAFHWGQSGISKPLILWINEGFMTIFFLLVGLEIKREMTIGELDSVSKATLPVLAAIGGMVVPALVYWLCNRGQGMDMRGWAIPVATDIAFALGILSLLGARIPISLKVFLTALAIFDDIGAILIIAVFYASGIHFLALSGALGCLCVLLLFNRFKVGMLFPYVVVGALMWCLMLESGLHATLTGVVLAMTIPVRVPMQNSEKFRSPVRKLERRLHPWVAWCILPLFAFANSGVSFANMQWAQLWHGVPVGIALGLLLGKPLGIFGSAWLAIRSRVAVMPTHASWLGLLGVACVCGVGFTMSLFIGSLAFDETQTLYEAYVRCGVLGGSLLAGVLGYGLLHFSHRHTLVQAGPTDEHS